MSNLTPNERKALWFLSCTGLFVGGMVGFCIVFAPIWVRFIAIPGSLGVLFFLTLFFILNRPKEGKDLNLSDIEEILQRDEGKHAKHRSN